MQAGADPEGSDEAESLTSLHRAAYRGFLEVVNVLISRGANLEAHGAADSTALHLVRRLSAPLF